MKICYENLEGFKLTYSAVFLKNGRDSYVEMDSCERCGDPFFALDPDYGIACCEKCHYKYGHTDECNSAVISNKLCV